MTFGKQWLIEITQKVDNLERENIALKRQLAENTQLVRALEEWVNSIRPVQEDQKDGKRPRPR